MRRVRRGRPAFLAAAVSKHWAVLRDVLAAARTHGVGSPLIGYGPSRRAEADGVGPLGAQMPEQQRQPCLSWSHEGAFVRRAAVSQTSETRRARLVSALTPAQRQILALCSLTVADDRCDWGVIARQADRERSLDGLLAGDLLEDSKRADRTRWVVRTASDDRWRIARERADAEHTAAAAAGARITTVLDDDFPLNLRLIHNLPPFLYYRGELDSDRDAHSMAVVGTRRPSAKGLERAGRMSRRLAELGITVTSGLAAGIDTEAHRAALAAGGRTIAVFGTGITTCFPAQNRGLADEIVDSGGLIVSQFFPTAPTARWMFGKRNEVTSGISQGTVVIEASSTSGARMQARLAYEHGKGVFLVNSLVSSQEWAQDMIGRRRATAVEHVEDVTSRIVDIGRLRAIDEELHIEPALL